MPSAALPRMPQYFQQARQECCFRPGLDGSSCAAGAGLAQAAPFVMPSNEHGLALLDTLEAVGRRNSLTAGHAGQGKLRQQGGSWDAAARRRLPPWLVLGSRSASPASVLA